MKFFNRTQELKRLDNLLAHRQAEFGIIYGRRRVGKTRLLLEWAKKNKGFYLVADQSNAAMQRYFFAHELDRLFPGFGDVRYPSWQSFFERISQEAAARQWKGPLIIDELPYLVQAAGELPSILQKWVDHDMRESELVLVVAGSSQRMMQGLVLDAAAPLYGRAKEMIHLKPLSAGYIQDVFSGISNVTAVENHTVWGGIPYYWELASETGLVLDEAVDYLVLDPMGPLHMEPDKLLLEETPPAIAARPVLDAIGLGAHRLSEIAGRVNLPATSLNKPLQRMTEMGILYKETPFGESEKSGKRSLYRMADPFFRFWFSLVAPHKAYLAQIPKKDRIALWHKYRTTLYAQMWEELCRLSVPRLPVSLFRGERPAWGVAGRFWRGNSPEWDIVARSSNDKSILLGEVKWSGKPYSQGEVDKLFNKLKSKGIPPVFQADNNALLYAIFIPETADAKVKPPADGVIITAEDVLSALRD
jgi:hypothetical protein